MQRSLYHTLTSAREYHRVNKMIQPIDIGQPLSVTTPTLAQWMHKLSGYDGTVGRTLCTGPIAWIPTYQGRSIYRHHNMSNLPVTETNAKSPVWHHPSRRSISQLMASWLFGAFSILEEAEIQFDSSRHIFWLWVYLSCLQGFSQHHQMKPYRVFDPPA